jgi:cytochrome c oxidase cbb3-type subunit III
MLLNVLVPSTRGVIILLMRLSTPALCGLLLAAVSPGQTDPHAGGDVAEGLRLYTANCAACHGVDGDSIPAVDLKSGQFRRIASDKDRGDKDLARIITDGIPGTAMPPASFTPTQVSHVIAYVRSLKTAPAHAEVRGDSTRGKTLLEGKGGCMKCHQVAGSGSRVGPDLTGIGKLRSPVALQSSILDPNRVVLPQHRYIQATARDGRAIYGRRLGEDTLTVQLIDSKEELISLPKSALREYVVLKTSPMPPYMDKLTAQEVADIVSYLVSLK